MGINMLALAITKFLLNVVFNTNGSFTSPDIDPIPRVHLSFLEGIPVVNDLLNDWSLMEWFVIVLIIILQFLFYKTVWGLRLRAVGQFEEAAKTAGIKVNAVKYQAIFIAGLIGGLAGAHLSLGYSTPVYGEHDQQPWFHGALPLCTSAEPTRYSPPWAACCSVLPTRWVPDSRLTASRPSSY